MHLIQILVYEPTRNVTFNGLYEDDVADDVVATIESLKQLFLEWTDPSKVKYRVEDPDLLKPWTGKICRYGLVEFVSRLFTDEASDETDFDKIIKRPIKVGLFHPVQK